MIRKVNKIGILTAENFTSEMLVTYRLAPFVFDLRKAYGVASPKECYLNTDISKQGAHDLIEYIKNLAIAGIEIWSPTQLLSASQAKAIYITYLDFNEISLSFSKNAITLDKLESDYPDATCFISHDTSEMGLIVLVNEFLNWMEL